LKSSDGEEVLRWTPVRQFRNWCANSIVAYLRLVDPSATSPCANRKIRNVFFRSRSQRRASSRKKISLKFNMAARPVDLRGFTYKEQYIHGCILQGATGRSGGVTQSQPTNSYRWTLRRLRCARRFLPQPSLDMRPVWDIPTNRRYDLMVTSNEWEIHWPAVSVGKGRAALMRLGHGSVIAGNSVKDAVFTT